ncbi:MAG TPA: hypothetical protein VHP83_19035 [Aggregatilineaceae bacterium]|nr:hypothetical protein [Aggregatilineaceae bacterium]
MTLHDLIAAIDRLSSEELRELREYIDARESRKIIEQSPQERTGTTQAELNDITEAMNSDLEE